MFTGVRRDQVPTDVLHERVDAWLLRLLAKICTWSAIMRSLIIVSSFTATVHLSLVKPMYSSMSLFSLVAQKRFYTLARYRFWALEQKRLCTVIGTALPRLILYLKVILPSLRLARLASAPHTQASLIAWLTITSYFLCQERSSPYLAIRISRDLIPPDSCYCIYVYTNIIISLLPDTLHLYYINLPHI